VVLTTCLIVAFAAVGHPQGPEAVVAAWNVAAGRSDSGGVPVPPDRLARIAEVSCQPPRGNLLDGFAIASQHTGEFVAGSVRLLRFGDLGSTCSKFALPSSSTYVSDYLPLTVRFRTDTDDD
jgi:hypothetical protein